MLKRFGLILVSLFAASVIIFLITEIIPGDVAQMILGRNVTPDALAALRERLGLMNPPYVRYLHWLGGILQGKLGDSLSMQGVHISDLIIRKGLNSLFLAAASTILLVPLSLLLGVIAGLKEQKWPDSVISTFSLIAISLPEFISGTFLMLVFSVWLRWLPAASSINLDVSLFRQLHLLVLPVVTVSLVLLGYVARMVRASVIAVSVCADSHPQGAPASAGELPSHIEERPPAVSHDHRHEHRLAVRRDHHRRIGLRLPRPGEPRPVRHHAEGCAPDRGCRSADGRRVSCPEPSCGHRLRPAESADQVLTI